MLLGCFQPTCAHQSFVPDSAHGFQARQGKGPQASHRYQIYLPQGFSKEQHLPIVVYLHGGGERGKDGIQPTQVGLGPIVWEQNGRFPFIVLFPQCESGSFWAMPEMEQRVNDAIQEAVCEYGGDPSRIYLTGNSMGGYGTWIYATRHPGRFAALVPLCGGVVPPPGVPMRAPKGSIAAAPDPYAAAAQLIGQTPVWAFHGGSDWVMPPKITRKMVTALRAAGNQAKHTEYPGVGHEVEVRAYREPGLWDWVAAQRAPSPPPISCGGGQ